MRANKIGMKKAPKKTKNNKTKVRKRKLKSNSKNNNNSKMTAGSLLRKRNETILKKNKILLIDDLFDIFYLLLMNF